MANVLIERKGMIGLVTVNRPEQMNSMNSETRSDLANAFTDLGKDSDISVIILTGAPGKAFIAGADIKEFLERDMSSQEALEEDWIVTKVISNLSKPVIAMIDGFCLGGGLEIAMACDLRIASDRTKLGQPEINLGIIPGAGGTSTLDSPVLTSSTVSLNLALTLCWRNVSIPISNPIKFSKRFLRLALRLSERVLTVTSKSRKYESEKSCTVPDSLVTIEPAGNLCNLITRFASVSPRTASSKDSHDGA